MASMRRTILRAMKRNRDAGKSNNYISEKLNRRERRAQAKRKAD